MAFSNGGGITNIERTGWVGGWLQSEIYCSFKHLKIEMRNKKVDRWQITR